MWVTAYWLGLPWYVDLTGTLVVLMLGWFAIGILTRMLINKTVDDTYWSQYHGDRKFRDQAAVDSWNEEYRSYHRAGWGIALAVLTGIFWPTVPALGVVAVVVTGIVLLGIGTTKLGDKTGGIGESRKEANAQKAELLRKAEEANDTWLKERLDEVEREWEKLRG